MPAHSQPRCTLTALAAAALLAACGGSDDAPVPLVLGASAASCDALRGVAQDPKNAFPPQLVVADAVYTPAVAASGASPATPEHCKLSGTLNARTGAESSPGVTQAYAIKWQVRLPTTWNGNFAMPGGGGLNGSVPDTLQRLREGYVTAASDSGHDNAVNNDPLAAGTGAFATDPQARIDFAYNAITQTRQLADRMMAVYYGQAPRKAYFEGCSMGGREAMMVTQRLPEQFDGVVSGDPGFKLASMSTHEVYNAQALAQLAQQMGLVSANGLPLASNTYTNQDLQLVSKAVLDTCDALDGLADGMVNKPLLCTTDRMAPALNALQCAGAKTPSCLSGAQIGTLLKMYAGPVTPQGARPYYPWMWDAGIGGCTSAENCNTPGATNIATGWRSWKIGSYQSNPATAQNNALDFTGGAGGALSTVLAPTPPVLPAPTAAEGLFRTLLGFDLDTHLASLTATSTRFTTSSVALLDADSTDYTRFKARNGKLVIHQPQSGGPFSPMAMVDWYQKLNLANGGTAQDYAPTQSFARLFMVPGMQHCSGGPGTTSYDAFAAMVAWVEQGTAPGSIRATAPAATPWPGRTRPLCPFPSAATYSGSGSIEDAANFSCR